MASQLFYKMVTEHTAAEKDQDHINMILLSDTSMPDRTPAILSGKYEELYQQLLNDARFLEAGGCTAIGITCNTSHFFADRLAGDLSIPVIHMVREAARAVADAVCDGEMVSSGKTVSSADAVPPCGERLNCRDETFGIVDRRRNRVVGIMATDGTVQTSLYQKELRAQGLTPFVPSEAIQKEVMYQIYGRIKNGQPYDEESWGRIEAEYQAAGCERVLLACTELSVIKADEKLSDWYVDSMEILARRVIAFAGKEWRELRSGE